MGSLDLHFVNVFRSLDLHILNVFRSLNPAKGGSLRANDRKQRSFLGSQTQIVLAVYDFVGIYISLSFLSGRCRNHIIFSIRGSDLWSNRLQWIELWYAGFVKEHFISLSHSVASVKDKFKNMGNRRKK